MGSRNNTDMKGVEITQLGWMTIGTMDATTGDADGALGATERDFASADLLNNTVSYTNLPPEITTVEIRFIFLTNDADAIMDIWMMREDDTQMRKCCKLTCKGGAQTIVINSTTYYLADTITVGENLWPTSAVTTSGADTMAITRFKPDGYSTMLFHGRDTFDEDVIVQVSGYSGSG